MYANIIPFTRIPLARSQTYTYRFDDAAVAVGHVATVPLHNRRVNGIVTSIQQTPPDTAITYKTITAIADPTPLLSPLDIQTLHEVADYYYTSVGLLCKHVLPAIPKRSTKKLQTGMANLPLHAITCPLPRTHRPAIRLLNGPQTERRAAYQAAIATALANQTQILILVPTMSLMPPMLAWLAQHFPTTPTVALTPERSKTDELLDWRSLQAGVGRIAVGTRRAVFSAFRELGLIIVTEEDDISYKQWDMNPRYHAPTVALMKARHYGCDVLLDGPVPSVTSWVRVRQGAYQQETSPATDTAIRLTDMRAELRARNFTSISYDLETAIAAAHANDKQALVLVNRRGSSRFVLCRDCGYVARCPHCAVALTEHRDSRLRCLHCTFSQPIPLACPSCNSPRIKGFGAGIEKVAHELTERFPKARLVCWDYKHTPRYSDVQTYYRDAQEADIIITTQAAIRVSLPRLGVTAAIDADATFNMPAWHAVERGWTLLHALTQTNDTQVIIQTYNPEHPMLTQMQQHAHDAFYARELKERRAFRYPPFVKMITLICRHDDKSILAGEVQRVMRQLHEVVPANAVLGPLEPLTPKIRGFWYRHILLKLAFSDHSAKLENILKHLSNFWSIDVDPMT